MSSSPTASTRRSGQLPTVAGEPGRGVTASWWYTLVSLVVATPLLLLGIAGVLLSTLDHRDALEGGGALIVVLLLLCLPGALWGCWSMRHGMGRGWPSPVQLTALLAPPAALWGLTLMLPGTGGTGALPLWMAATILASPVGARARRVVLAVGAAAFLLHIPAARSLTGTPTDEPPFVIVLLAVMCPLIYLATAWAWDVVLRLDEARAASSQLAVAQERLRFASDLHDIQGHHLQVIALKAELAERLLAAGSSASHSDADDETAGDSDHDTGRQAATESVREVAKLAQTALAETRQLVRDLRQVSFADEVANARDVLEAAGAATTVRITSWPDDRTGRLLGLAVREATTNILRHAQARTVRIAVGPTSGTGDGAGERTGRTERGEHDDGITLQMCNDGVPRHDGAGAAASSAPGTGLAGLAQRFAEAGGTVSGQEHDDGTFVLTARVPDARPREAPTDEVEHQGDEEVDRR